MPDLSRDSIRNTLFIAVSLSVVCSIMVASTAVLLKPVQQRNEEEFRQRIILQVAGLLRPDVSVESLFSAIETRVVDFASGDYVDETVAGADTRMIAIADADDIAKIRQRPVVSRVYLVRDGQELQQIILPVHGAGLWSTMHGYLSVAADGRTVNGLRFYSHAETPGLGDQIDDPAWLQLWVGKQLYGETGNVQIEVIRGMARDRNSKHEVDGMSGATLTGRGVSQLVRYWTGPHGFGPYLQKIQTQRGESS